MVVAANPSFVNSEAVVQAFIDVINLRFNPIQVAGASTEFTEIGQIPSEHVFFGDLPFVPSSPAIMVFPEEFTFEDHPQNEGNEVRGIIRIFFFAYQMDVERNYRKVTQMGDIIKRVIQEDATLRTNFLYSAHLQTIRFGELVKPAFQGGPGVGYGGGFMDVSFLYDECLF